MVCYHVFWTHFHPCVEFVANNSSSVIVNMVTVFVLFRARLINVVPPSPYLHLASMHIGQFVGGIFRKGSITGYGVKVLCG